jgi:hypothetical protein
VPDRRCPGGEDPTVATGQEDRVKRAASRRPRRRPVRVGILIKFHEGDRVVGYPLVDSDVGQLELARRLRRLAGSIIESPTLAERLAGLPADLGR